MSRLLVRLYPRAWRERYGSEFEALLEERPLGPFDVADVFLAAFDARLHFGRSLAADNVGGLSWTIRVGSCAAVLGGLFWLVGFLTAQFNGSDDDGLGQWLVFLGTLGLLVALTGLSAVQSRLHPRLVWAAFALPAFGGLVSGSGLLGMLFTTDEVTAGFNPWALWATGTVVLVAGSGLFALVSWRSRVLPRPGLALLAAPMIGLVPVVVVLSGLVAIPWEPLVSIALLALLFSFGIGWIVVGIDTAWRDRQDRRVVPRTAP
jgi:hypothetical protein